MELLTLCFGRWLNIWPTDRQQKKYISIDNDDERSFINEMSFLDIYLWLMIINGSIRTKKVLKRTKKKSLSDVMWIYGETKWKIFPLNLQNPQKKERFPIYSCCCCCWIFYDDRHHFSYDDYRQKFKFCWITEMKGINSIFQFFNIERKKKDWNWIFSHLFGLLIHFNI